MTYDTFTSDVRIAIVGAGAAGSYYGGRLAENGRDVHFLFRSDYAAVKQCGLYVQSPAGNFDVPPSRLNAYDDPALMPKVDLVVVALKTTANQFYEPLISPLLKADTAIVTLQNGLGNEERLAHLFGPERIMGCMAYTCINRDGPGQIRHVAQGFNRMGDFSRGLTDRARAVAAMFSASKLPCEPIADLRMGRWEKLAWNAPLNGLTALLNQTTDQLLASTIGLDLFREIVSEILTIGRHLGITLSEALIDQHVDRAIQLGRYHTSMQVDRQKRRPLEVEAILGEPLRAAERMSVVAPHIRTLYMLVKMLDTSICRSPFGGAY